MQLSEGLRMVRQIGVHAVDNTEVIRVSLCQFRKERRHPETGFPMLRKFGTRPKEAGSSSAPTLAIAFLQLGLVVKGVHVRGPTLHAEKNDPLGPGRKMPGPG